MQSEIEHIAAVRTGAYLKEVPNGNTYYLQVKDFDKAKQEFILSEPTLELNDKTEKYLLQDGDIVFAAKGFSNFGVVYREEMGKIIPSSSFLIIRINHHSIIDPDYLCWILNREDTLMFFKSKTAGNVMPSINIAMMAEYEIDIPNIQTQKRIVEISKLQQHEQQLYEKISALHNKLIQQQLIKIIQK
jgi:restriction endonuclease S subunit